MEMPSFVTWSGLEEILKGKQTPSETAFGPSTALQDHLKIIGKIDQDVTVLDEKCQVLDEKVQEHEVTLHRLEPEVVSLKSTVKAASSEVSSLVKLKKVPHSDKQIEADAQNKQIEADTQKKQIEADIQKKQIEADTHKKQIEADTQNADESDALDNFAGNVRQLVSKTGENLDKIHDDLNCSSALTERRLLALEDAVAELRETIKMQSLNLSLSDIDLSQSGRDLSPKVGPVETNGSLLTAYDGGKQEDISLSPTPSSLSDTSDVGKNKTGNLTVSTSPPAKKNVPGDIQELHTKLRKLNRKLKLQIKRDRGKMDEFASKLQDITEHVTKLRMTVSCEEAEESSCLRLMQREVDQLQTDVRKITDLGLEARALAEKVELFEVSHEHMLSDLTEVSGKFTELKSTIADLESKMQKEEVVWNQFLESVTGTVHDSMKQIHLEMVSVRKDVQCHLHKLNDDVSQLHHVLDEFGDSGAGVRRKLKFQCLSCDRKLLVTALEPPSDSCPAQAGFQSSLSAHPYTSFEMENVRNRQKACLLPKQLTNFQRAILERHMARLRMRDFRAYFMQCWNDLPEVKMAKSNKCSTLYEREAEFPDIYSRLSRNSGGPMYTPFSSSLGQFNPNGKGKCVEYVDPFNLTQVGNKSSDLTPCRQTANNNSTKKPRDSQMPFHARRNVSRGKGLTKCQKLLIPDDPHDANTATSVAAQEMQQLSTSSLSLERLVTSPL